MRFFHRFSALLFLTAAFAFSGCSATQEIPLLSEGQKQYVRMPRKERIAYFADPQCRAEMKGNGYYPMTFRLDAGKAGKISLAELTDPEVKCKETAAGIIKITTPAYVLAENEGGTVSFGNLKIAKTYQWKCDDGRSGTFRTEDLAPRLLKIEGVPNVRDLGGRVTMDGRRVRQGMVYRTAGLNDNASRARRLRPQADLEANGGFLAKQKAELERRIAETESLLKNGDKKIKVVPYSLQSTWTVYLPSRNLTEADYAMLASLKELPDSLLGGKAFTMKSDAKGKMMFPEPNVNHPSVFCQVFESPADGIMPIGTGADWYYAVYVNGRIYLNLLDAGDGNGVCDANNHILYARVKKGKNIIVIPLRSGLASWSLAVGRPARELSYNTMLKQDISSTRQVLKETVTVLDTHYTKGRNRLDEAARDYVVRDLGIRSDIDLRSDGECWGMTGSPAGKEVQWFHYSSASYGGMQRKWGKDAFEKVFRVFLNRKNYPIVFHCIAGQDRTGAVAFIINALLGVPEEQLYLDWEVTGFWNGSAGFNHAKLFNKLYSGFDNFPGKTINERVENYVLSLGFTGKDIAELRSIMLEDR